MEKFENVTLTQVVHRKAFVRGDNFFLIKKNEKIRIHLILEASINEIAIFIAHDSEVYRTKMVRSCQDNPAFSMIDPEFMFQPLQLKEYNKVLAYTMNITPSAQEIELYVKFNELSTSAINNGEKHDARQWNLVFLTKSNGESCWNKLAKLPIQVVREVTGCSRLPQARKRVKRSDLKRSGYVQENKPVTSTCGEKAKKMNITSSPQILSEVKQEKYLKYSHKKNWKNRYCNV